MINWIKKFDDWYFYKEGKYKYFIIEKVVCYMLLIIMVVVVILDLAQNNSGVTLMYLAVFLIAGGISFLIRRQAEKRGNVK